MQNTCISNKTKPSLLSLCNMNVNGFPGFAVPGGWISVNFPLIQNIGLAGAFIRKNKQ